MTRQKFVPIQLGVRRRRPEWLVAYASWRILALTFGLTLLLALVGSLLVVWRQPHLFQGDARWGEVRALLLPAGLAGGLTLIVALLLILNAVWQVLVAVTAVLLIGLKAMWTMMAWMARGIGAGFGWLFSTLLRPASQGLAYLLRVTADTALRLLLRPAGLLLSRLSSGTGSVLGAGWDAFVGLVVRPVRSAALALLQQLVRPALRLLFQSVAWAYRLVAEAAAWGARTLSQLIGLVIVQPLQWITRGLGWGAGRLLNGIRTAVIVLLGGWAAGMRAAGWVMRVLGTWIGQALRSGYRRLTAGVILGLALLSAVATSFGALYLAGQRQLVLASGAALRGFLAGLAFLMRASAMVWRGIRLVVRRLLAADHAVRVWYRSRSEAQKLTLLGGGLVVQAALGLVMLAIFYPFWQTGDAPLGPGMLIFSPTLPWALSLAVAVERVIRPPLERGLAWLGSMVARGLTRVGRLLAAILSFAVGRPLRFLLSLLAAVLTQFVVALVGLAQQVVRQLVAPFAAGLRAVVGFLAAAANRLGRALQPAFPVGGRLLTGTLVLGVVGTTVFWLGRGTFAPVVCRLGMQAMCPPSPCPAPAGASVVSFYSSNTKEDWINAVTGSFNAAQFTTASGKPIYVCVTHGSSGSHQSDLRDGRIEPTVWSPGDQSWVDEINQIWQDRGLRPLVPEACRPIAISPIGFVMWRSMAEALGWPDEKIGWDTLVALSTDARGWGRYGHPEWGTFKFGHTHPDRSNSGLLILTALAHDVLGQTEALTIEQVGSPEYEAAMRTVELHTDHYGIQSRDLISLMVKLGRDYLHAVNTTEAETLRTNLTRQAELAEPLAFIIPGGGTYWTEQPYCVLDAEWVTDEQREAARVYGDYLLAPEQQALAPANYLRPLDPTLPLSGPFALENGTDPRVTRDDLPELPSPSPAVSALVKDMFHRTKKKATIIILLDISGSMEGERMSGAIEATVAFLRQMDRDDEVYVYTFADRVTELGQGGPARMVEEPLSAALQSLTATGGTALYDAVCQAGTRMGQLREAHAVAGEERLYGIVLLSDGEDKSSALTKSEMYACLPTADGERTKIFAIMYGAEADHQVLADIASKTLGRAIPAEASNLAEVYLAIAAEQ